MSNNMVPIVIGVVVGGGIAAVIAYQIARFLRGSIKLSLPRTAFNPGETIKGSFDLHTKKAVQGNKLTVNLIGVQVTKTHKDGKTQTHSHEVYRDERLIEDAREYPAGHTARHEFELAVPNMGSSSLMNSTVGLTFSAALSLIGNKQTRLEWRIEARLDAKGVDLAACKGVSVSMPQLL